MSRFVETWDGVAAVVRRDASMFWTYRMRVVTQSVSLLFSLTLFYYVSRLVHVTQFPTSDAYFAFVAVGLVILTVLTATLTAVPLGVRQELVAGTFERFVVSPLGPAAGIAAMTIFPMVSALAMGGLQLAIAAVVFGLHLHWSTAALAIPVGALGALALVPFALLMASAVVVVKQVSGGVTFVTTGMAFVGGFFFPVSLLPAWIGWASHVQPFTPSLELLRHYLIGTPLTGAASAELLRIAAFAAILIPASAILLDRSVAICRRRGTLTEY